MPICEACNQSFTRNENYRKHFTTPKHLENQAVYDGNMKVYFSKEREEWEKKRAELLKINKSDQECLLSVMKMNDGLRNENERYKLALESRDMQEKKAEGIEELYHNHMALLNSEREKWAKEKADYEKRIKIMERNNKIEMECLLNQNREFMERLAELEMNTGLVLNEVIAEE